MQYLFCFVYVRLVESSYLLIKTVLVDDMHLHNTHMKNVEDTVQSMTHKLLIPV